MGAWLDLSRRRHRPWRQAFGVMPIEQDPQEVSTIARAMCNITRRNADPSGFPKSFLWKTACCELALLLQRAG
jgi:hypothetical protein